MLTIGIDIDDTITNTFNMMKINFFKTKNKDLIDNMEKIIRGYIVNDVTIEFFKELKHSFVDEIKVKKGAKEAINKLKQEGNKVIIITARADNYFGDAHKLCYDYLVKQGILFDKIIVNCKSKLETCINEKIDILIDDSVDEVNKALELGINAILVTSPLNVNRKCSTKRFKSWSLIYKYIEQKYGNLKN